MKHLFYLIPFFIVVGITSCNKDQRAVKDISGTWEQVMIDGIPTPDSLKPILSLSKCKLKKETYCDGSLVYPNDSTIVFDYRIAGEGTVLYQTLDLGIVKLELSSTIDELTEETLVLSTSYTSTPVVTEYIRK